MLMFRYCSRLRDCQWHYNWKEFLSRTFFGIVRFLLFVFAIAFASVFSSPCLCSTNGQWQVGVLAVFLGWINMITFIKLVPRLGVYVLMFLNVIYSFLKMLILGFLLLVAFGLAFYMLFRNPSEMVCLQIRIAFFIIELATCIISPFLPAYSLCHHWSRSYKNYDNATCKF